MCNCQFQDEKHSSDCFVTLNKDVFIDQCECCNNQTDEDSLVEITSTYNESYGGKYWTDTRYLCEDCANKI